MTRAAYPNHSANFFFSNSVAQRRDARALAYTAQPGGSVDHLRATIMGRGLVCFYFRELQSEGDANAWDDRRGIDHPMFAACVENEADFKCVTLHSVFQAL